MQDKARMSAGTKRALSITGIVFGTIFLFIASFFLSLYFIIHPIKITKAADNSQIVAENQKLKVQIKSLEDEIEHLTATSDKNNSDINPAAPAEIPTATTPSNGADSDSKLDNETTDDEDFAPDMVITPDGGYKPEPETDITIIDISE